MGASPNAEIARTEAKSASLSRELRLADLVFLQVLLIVGLPWIGYAARQGAHRLCSGCWRCHSSIYLSPEL